MINHWSINQRKPAFFIDFTFLNRLHVLNCATHSRHIGQNVNPYSGDHSKQYNAWEWEILVWPKADFMNRTQRKCQPWFSQGLKRENLLRRSSTVVWRYFLFLMFEIFDWGSPKKMWNGNFAVASEAPCQAGVGSTFPCGSTSQVKRPCFEELIFKHLWKIINHKVDTILLQEKLCPRQFNQRLILPLVHLRQ